MFLFTRRLQIDAGHNREAMEWALGQTERVNKITGLPVSLYMQVYSPDVGAIGWSTFVPDLVALEAAGDKLNADEAFMSAVEKGAALTMGAADDSLSQVIYGEPDPNRQIEYVTGVRTVCANGSLARGMELGVEIAQRAEKITGTPTLFLADVTGTYGAVGWVSGHASVQAVEAAQQALAADPSWATYLDKEVRGTYVDEPSLTTQLIYRRLA
jgi:hypothetical protein